MCIRDRPLYRADDLGEAVASTPAKLTGLNLQTYLGDGKTVDIVTDPLQYKRTIEYHTDIGTSPLPSNAPFWGKDFLLVDVDSSGPVSVDIPPGTYNGVELAAVVENALRDGFGVMTKRLSYLLALIINLALISKRLLVTENQRV
mgnify:CR=1 FL=1